MRVNEKSLAYALLRIAIGVNFAGHGLIRFHIGLSRFASSTAGHLTNSPLPHGLVLAFLYVVPIIETLVGIALVFGVLTRSVLVVSALLMVALTIGVTSNQQWDIASEQLIYSIVLFLLLYLHEYNGLSVDSHLRRSRRGSGRLSGPMA